MKSKELIKNYCSNNPKTIIKIVLLMLASIVLLIGFPLILRFIVELFTKILDNKTVISMLDTTVNAQRIQELNDLNHKYMVIDIILVISLGLDVILSFLSNTMLDHSISKFGSDITEELRNASYSCLLKGEYYEIDEMNTNEALDVLLNDTDLIGNKYIANHLLKIIYYAATFLSCLILLFTFNATAGLIVLGTVPVVYLATRYIGKFVSKQNDKFNALTTQRDDEIKENINNLKNVKIRDGINKEEKDYIDISNKIRKNANTSFTLNAISSTHLNIFISDIVVVSLVSIFLYAVYESASFNLSLAFASILLAPIVYNHFHKLLDYYFEKLYVSEAFNKVDNILDIRPESRNESLNSLSDEVHTLTFSNVSYEYNLSQKGVDKLSFELKKGEKLGILGYQKSGKTTISDLIVKVIRPRFGNILINNCDINKLSTAYLREIVAYVPQDFKLFDGTIEENITYPNAIDEYKYNDALNKSKLKILLMNLPKRDQENALSINLSAADVSRIGLANAFYKDSPIIILDDSTSKLDATLEKEIMEEFFKLKNKIMIITSTRISTLMKCDKILILNDGKVVEYGNTSDLINNSRSTYSKMIHDANR